VVGTDETVRDGETGYLVELDDAGALADRLEQLHRDPALRERLGARGRQVVEAEFDEAAIVRSLATHYRQLLLAKGLAAQASRLRTVEP
jgi:glycosyltransferase involved in cell wall biosynthesis